MVKGLRFTKRITLIPRLLVLNIFKTGFSLTIGPPGLCINIPVLSWAEGGRSGTTGTVGAPGTGLSYRRRLWKRRGRS